MTPPSRRAATASSPIRPQWPKSRWIIRHYWPPQNAYERLTVVTPHDRQETCIEHKNRQGWEVDVDVIPGVRRCLSPRKT
jgi:hypothetical protein